MSKEHSKSQLSPDQLAETGKGGRVELSEDELSAVSAGTETISFVYEKIKLSYNPESDEGKIQSVKPSR